MSGDVTVTSTTDTQEAVDAAAAYGRLAVDPKPEAENTGTSEAAEAETVAKQEPAPEEEEPEEEKEPAEDEGEEEEPESQAMGKTRRKLLRTVSRLNRERYDLRERLEIAEQKLQRLERGGKEEPPAAAAPGEMAKPNKDSYTDVDLYVVDMYKWMRQQEAKAEQERKIAEYKQEVDQSYGQQLDASRDLHEDFDAVVSKGGAIPDFVPDLIRELDNGTEVAYYIAKHAEIREQFMHWNQPYLKGGRGRIITAVFNISDQLSGNGKSDSEEAPVKSNGSPKPTRPVRTAPAPIEPVRGGSARVAVPPDQLPYREFVKYRESHGASRR